MAAKDKVHTKYQKLNRCIRTFLIVNFIFIFKSLVPKKKRIQNVKLCHRKKKAIESKLSSLEEQKLSKYHECSKNNKCNCNRCVITSIIADFILFSKF